MVGVSEVADSPRFPLGNQIFLDPKLRVQIIFDIILANIVEKIKVKIFRLQFFQLLRENFLYFREVVPIVARKLRG